MEELNRRREARNNAKRAARAIRKLFEIEDKINIPIGVILGTGWGDTLRVRNPKAISVKDDVPGFQRLQHLAGHARELVYGVLGDKRVIALRGRVHLNESFIPDDQVALMVRLQVEMLIELGVKVIVACSAVGDIFPGVVPVNGRVVAIAGFSTLFSGPLPLFAGEFINADNIGILDPDLRRLAKISAPKELEVVEGGHAMIRGPNFASTSYGDYALLRAFGVRVIGMSLLPEASVVAARHLHLEPDDEPCDTAILCLGNITDTPDDHLSHELVQERAKKLSPKLGELLENIVRNISIREADL